MPEHRANSKARSGKVSSEKDLQGRRRIDASELTRVYGKLKQDNGTPEQSDESVRDTQVNTDDTPQIVALLEGQVQDLKAQLDTATAEKAQLLDLLSAEKEEKREMRALMPPADEKGRSRNWLLRLVGARIVPSSQKATCLIFASLIHSANQSWVALLRDGNLTPFSATLPL